MNTAVLYALGAAVLFGASTPLAKLLVGEIPPILLGGLLYLGSGLGLLVVRLLRDRGWRASGLTRQEWPWLLGAILFGGVFGPVLLMTGLATTPASTASLLLNLESVLTALIAWIVFREGTDRRIVSGMIAIVAGGVVLSWPQESAEVVNMAGPLAIAGACLCWAIDNNLTRKVSATDAVFIAGSKGLIAGVVNCTIALAIGLSLPAPGIGLATLLVGLLGYGVSLVLFVLALRGLGTARTGAYFGAAPFIGAVVSLVLLSESTSPGFWLAGVLMAVGVWLHLTERHDHEHVHPPIEHTHPHRHDAHHQHAHEAEWDGHEPHTHRHAHAAMTHSHAHYPDSHHRHGHDTG